MATYAESIEGISTDFETALIDPVEEVPEQALTGFLASDVYLHDLNGFVPGLGIIVEDDSSDAIL